MESGATLAELLAAALPSGPAALSSKQSAGAALALALHCLMVRDGYVLLDRSGRRLPGATPPPGWNDAEHAWVFDYERPGGALRFRLQCALQAATRRMFVHACELGAQGEPRQDNIQIMGVQVLNYVPAGDDVASSGGRSWQGVIANERTLADMFNEFISLPLWRHAERLPEGAAVGGGWQLLQDRRHAALALAVGLTAVAAGVLLWRHRSSVTAS